MRLSSRVLSFLVVLFVLVGISSTTFAAIHTSATPKARVTARVDNSKRTTLYGHVPSALRHAQDLGRVEPNKAAEHLIIVLKSDENQKHELRRIIDEQQDQHTANYHQWVTPEEFGAHFGAHDSDIAQVQGWLKSQGFKVEDVTKAKRAIHFSGTVGQIEKAFQIEMHYYLTPNGEVHVSNDRDISVPEALSPAIAGVPTLHNFFRRSHSEFGRTAKIKLGPKYSSSSATHYVAPGDFATIYNTAPLLAQGIDGTGVSIAVVGRSDILLSDVQTYRQMFNLPVNDPVFINAGQDPGILPGDDGESDLDVEIPGGVAPGATVKFVIGTPSFLVDGITTSIEYIVENNVADIMSISYGGCEAVEGTGGNAFNNQIFEQAAAQGISVFVAAGDNGGAGCDDQNDSWENLGYATGGEASTPYSVAVGGTEFYGDQGAGYSTYWSSSNNALGLNSALTYIPEYPWNESKSASPIPTGDSGSGLWSGSGGISAYYLRPSWQTGSGIPAGSDPALTQGGNWVTSYTITNPGSGYTTAPTPTFSGGGCINEPAAASTITGGQVTALTFNFGTQGGTLRNGLGFGCTSAPTIAFTAAPAGGTTATATVTIGQMQGPPPFPPGVPHRLTPDVSLNAASGHDATFFCSEGVCELNSSGGLLDAGLVGGTSVAAPSMAGVQALIDQANGGRQGMPGYIYYALANNQSASACNSSLPPAGGSNCAFQDVTLGNNFICGTSSCSGTTARMGFAAGTGYDMATGLGSPNAANLSSQWSSVVFSSSNTTLNLSQTTFAHGTPVTLSGTVAGSGTPTGDVAFIVSQGAIGDPVNPFGDGSLNGPVAFATLSGGSYSATLNNLPGGTYNVTARYGGDTTYGSSYSAPVQVTVASEGSGLTITPYALSGSACTITGGSTFSYASDILINLSVAGISGAGAPTGTVALSLDGTQIANLALDPNGNAYALSGAIASSSCIYLYNYSNVPTIAAGSHTLTASYSGDAAYNATTATPVSITVNPITPTVTLASGASQITSGFNTPLVATLGVTALTGASIGTVGPTGTVTFKDTTTAATLGSAPVVTTSVTVIGTGITTFTSTAALSTTGITQAGANSITATYNGDSNWNTATSSAATVTVGTFTTATTTTVTSNGNPTTLGGRPTFTATITGGAGPTSGAVTFYDGTAILGAGSTVGAAHTSTFRPGSSQLFAGGSHSITATFGGVSGTFGPSTSAVFTETVTQGTVTHDLTAKTVGASGQTYTFTDVVTPSSTSATYQPTGTVTFYDGATALGTSSLTEISSGNGGYGIYTAVFATSSLSAGTHTITATFNGDVNYASSTSNAQTVFVGGTPTITWATPSPITYGTALSATQLNATANIPGTFVYSPPSGTVLNAGSSTLTVTFTPRDYKDFGPQQKQVTLVVNPASQTIVLTGVPASAVYGASFTIGATGGASGNPVVLTSSGACSNVGTTYTMTSGVGTCSVIADQAGNTNYSAAPEVNDPVSATMATAGVSVACTPNPSTYAQSVTCTATISGQYGLVKGRRNKAKPMDVTGTVTWSANTGCGTTTVTSGTPGTASCTTTILPGGTDTVEADYSGDINHQPGSGTTSDVVNPASTSIAVTSVSPTSEDYGLDAPVTITAVLSYTGSAAPAGAVTIGGNGPSGYSATGCGAPSGGTLTCTATYTPTPADTPASYTETATFAGDTNYSGSSSPQTNNFTINGTSSTTAVTSTPNPSVYATPVTFTATISSNTGNVKGAARKNGVKPMNVTGTVTWSANTGCSPSTVSGYPGLVTCTTSAATHLPVGTDVVTATYSGDGNHTGSSGSVNQVVQGGIATSINVTSVSPAAEDYGADTPATITAVLSWTGHGTAPTASHITIGGNGPSGYSATSCAARVGDTITCTATYTPTTADPPGSYTETAAFSGDINYASSSSSQTNNFTINQATSSTGVTSNNNPSTYGQPVTFTATISGENGNVKGGKGASSKKPLDVTGTVTWSANTGCSPSTVSGYPGVATCTTSSLAGGTNTITATYSGDSNHSGSSGSVSGGQVVNQASQTITFTVPPPAEAAAGNVFTVVATGGASGNPVTFTVGAGSVCTLSGATYTMTSSPGHCYVVANQAGNSNYAAAAQVTTAVNAVRHVTKVAPTVTFTGAPATAPYLSTFTVATTANSGVTPTITTTTSAVCTVSGTTVTMTKGTGTCTVKAAWATNTYYLAASLTQSVTATQLSTNTTITTTATLMPSNLKKVTVYFTVSNGQNVVAGNVTVNASSGEHCTGTVATGKCLLTFAATGSKTLTATYAGNPNNSTSTSASYPLTVQ